jgi:hypothetical protein
MIWHSYTIYTRPLSVWAQYSRLCPISGSFRYNGSLVTRTVVCLTAAKYKPLVFSVTGFALSNGANIFIIMILHDLCLLPGDSLRYFTVSYNFLARTPLKTPYSVAKNALFLARYLAINIFKPHRKHLLRHCFYCCMSVFRALLEMCLHFTILL